MTPRSYSHRHELAISMMVPKSTLYLRRGLSGNAMATVVETHLAAATKATMDLLETRTARCNECTLSTYNLRRILVKRLGVSLNKSKLLVPLVIEILIARGLLEFWDRKTKGSIYRVNAAQFREIEMTTVPEMTSSR